MEPGLEMVESKGSAARMEEYLQLEMIPVFSSNLEPGMIEEGAPSQGIPVTAAALHPPFSPSQESVETGDGSEVTAKATTPPVSPSQESEGTGDGSHVSAAAPPPPVSSSQDLEENKEGS